MKKLFIPIIIIMLVPFIVIPFARGRISDCGVYNNTDISSMDVLAVGAFDKEGRDTLYGFDVSHWRDFCMSEEGSYIVYATALDGGTYGFRSSEMPFHIDEVLEGSKDIEGKDIALHSSFIYDGGFYEYVTEEHAHVTENLKALGYSEEEFSELMNIRAAYYSPINLPKPEHHYIMGVQKYSIDSDTDPYFFLITDYIDENDADDEKLVSPKTPLLKNYADNITLFYYQEDLESYCRFKKELYAFYNK